VKARDVETHLRSLDGGWVDWEDTTDGFVAGEPDTEVSGIAVVWMGTSAALTESLQVGCNLCIVHEPLYNGGQREEETMLRFAGVREKRAWIEESGLVVLRCHDLWDQMPRIGVPDSWARTLGLEHPVMAEGFVRVFEIPGETAGSVARHVAEAVRALGQEAVELVGDPEAPVRRPALGTGAITPFIQFVERYGADLAICTDDGFTYWREGGVAVDLGIPVVVVNHAVSELPGMESLASYLQERFPTTRVRYIHQRCMYALVGA
jgi:putative NIF3 family GTP cyclohydrolase 1 type 2